MPIDLSDRHRALLASILQRHLPNHTLWIFGSRARGDAKPHSDVDILLEGPPPSSLERAKLELALEESNLPFPVDLVGEWELFEEFASRIAAERVPFPKP